MAFNYNHTTLVGRLVKDPEWIQDKENLQRATFSLAIGRGYKKEDGKESVDFIPIVMWGKLARSAYQILKKGMPALVWGRIQIKNYQGEIGRKWSIEVVAENFQVLQAKGVESKEENEESSIESSENRV